MSVAVLLLPHSLSWFAQEQLYRYRYCDKTLFHRIRGCSMQYSLKGGVCGAYVELQLVLKRSVAKYRVPYCCSTWYLSSLRINSSYQRTKDFSKASAHTVRASALSLDFLYHLFSLRLFSSCLRLLPRIPVHIFFPLSFLQ